MKLLMEGTVVGSNPTPNGGASRVFVQDAARTNALLLVPGKEASKYVAGQKFGPVEVFVKIDQGRNGFPPELTYIVAGGWPAKSRAAAAAADEPAAA